MTSTQPDKFIPILLSHLAKFCVWFIWSTSRVKITIDPESKDLLSSNKPLIAALWHNRILLAPRYIKRFRPVSAVVSSHRDGDLVCEFLRRYKHDGIRGSSRRGGFSAIKQVMQHLRKDGLVVITPDGPLGPRYSINGNITNIAVKSNVAIIPICYSVKKAKVLKTWDGFIIPYPFNHIRIDVMKPAHLDHKLPEEEQKKLLQDTMLKQANKLDQETKLSHAKPYNPIGCAIYSMYRLLSFILHPFLKMHLLRRMAKGKENAASIKQKMGIYTEPRPKGQLIWIHAASIGESKSVLPLIDHLTKNHKTSILITTSTVTAAAFLHKTIANNHLVTHQFLILDTPQNTKNFFEHWRPDLGVFIDSELWPNILCESPCPMMLINARLSPSSFNFWRRMPWVFRFVMDSFKTISPTTEQDAEFLKTLGVAHKIHNLGNLKDASPLLQYDLDRYKESKKALPGFNFVCASTHEGEEIEILKELINAKLNLIIVPRHPNRGASIAKAGEKLGYETLLHSQHPIPSFKSKTKPHLYIVDKIGDLGLWYRIADLTFIGGSLVDVGGHNVMEAAQLGKPIITGPYTYNFSDAIKHLKEAAAMVEVPSVSGLKTAVLSLSKNKARLKKLGTNAMNASDINTEIISAYSNLILKVMHDNKQV